MFVRRMNMLRRIAVKLCLGFRSFKHRSSSSSSYNRINISKEYKNMINNNDTDPHVLINFGNGYFRFLSCSLLQFYKHAERYVHIDKYPIVTVQFPYNLLVSGPCNGLFCLYSFDGKVALWNPATGDVHNLSTAEENQEIEIQNVGFGFDSNTKDYKILRCITRRFLNLFYKSVDHMIHQVEIYSLKTNRWREIPVLGEVRSHLPCILSPAAWSSADRACYWTVPWEQEDEFNKRLISFDFVQEKFHIHCLPPNAYRFDSFEVFSFNGWCAAFGSTCHQDEQISTLMYVWMRMPVNGVKTWINPCMEELEVGPLCFSGSIYRPVCLWKNQGLILLQDVDNYLVYYDFLTNEAVGTHMNTEPKDGPKKLKTIDNPPVQVLDFAESFVANPW